MLNHLTSELPKVQSGFRKNQSTASALLKVTDGILFEIDKKKIVILVASNFSKAFDIVNDNLLLAILEYVRCGSEMVGGLKATYRIDS